MDSDGERVEIREREAGVFETLIPALVGSLSYLRTRLTRRN
jgi:hypothetical protein